MTPTDPNEVRDLEQLLADRAVVYAGSFDRTGHHLIEGAQHLHGLADVVAGGRSPERAADVLHQLGSRLADMGQQMLDEAKWLAESNSALLAADIDEAIRRAVDEHGGGSTP